MPNRLAHEISPYLRLHAENPIDWWPWGPDAFAEAKRRNVPVLLSVGYAACHWCHVMADESFSDEAVAAKVNAGFVAIKVDREERPDIDALYMLVTQALTGQGGWPMTVFLTPDALPILAGTYFPPEPRPDSPSFTEVVDAVEEAWTNNRDEVLSTAGQIATALSGLATVPQASGAVNLRDAVTSVLNTFDAVHGGFGSAPKFPTPTLIDALLVKGEPASLDVAQRTLDAMVRGGIHDQIGGGFARYSVDSAWVVPHFEKMLYDNGLLLATYTRAWCRTADHDPWLRRAFADAARGIVTWLTTEMQTEQGAFAASLDADSSDARGRPHEGIFYLWSPELLVDALGEEDADWAAGVFHVTTTGTFDHGLSTLQLRGTPDADRLARVKARLLEVRGERFRPMRDDKVVAAWNGWTIDALVRAAFVFNEPSWLDAARSAADAVWTAQWVDGRLRRVSRDGVAGSSMGVLSDYAAFAGALVTLAGALGETEYLDRARTLLDVVIAQFGAPDGGFFDTADDAEALFQRPREVTDNATPSGSSSAIAALHAFALATGESAYADRATQAAAVQGGVVTDMPTAAGSALTDALISDEARARLLRASAGVATADRFGDLARAAYRMIPAGTFVLIAPPGTQGFDGLLSDLDDLGEVAAEPTAIVRRGGKVLGPTPDLVEFRNALWTRV